MPSTMNGLGWSWMSRAEVDVGTYVRIVLSDTRRLRMVRLATEGELRKCTEHVDKGEMGA